MTAWQTERRFDAPRATATRVPVRAARVRLAPGVPLVLGILLGISFAHAEDVRVRLLDGLHRPGHLVSFSLTEGLEWQPLLSGPARVDAAEVVTIETLESSVSAPKNALRIYLVGGGSLYGKLGAAREDVIELDSQLLGTLRVPLEHVSALLTERGRRELEKNSVRSMVRRADRDADVLWFANGDRLTGSLVSVGSDVVRVVTETGPAEAPTEVLLAVFLANPAPARNPNIWARIRLTDSSELPVDVLTWYGPNVRAQAGGWLDTSFRSRFLAEVEVMGGRWLWLADLAPTEFEQRSLAGQVWPYRIDANVLDQPMRMKGRGYARGIGLHSASNIVYYLGGQYESFTALVGIDDSAGPLADADFRVRVDSRPGFQARGLRAGQDPLPVRVDVRGGQRLEIDVGFGRNADIQDRINLADAALIRKAPASTDAP